MFLGEDNEYFSWLCRCINAPRSYILLLYTLYSTEFYSVLPEDDNRIEDGLLLRETFDESNGYSYSDTPTGNCSILEIIVGLCGRIVEIMGSYNDKGEGYWFWILLNNLFDNLSDYKNEKLARSMSLASNVEHILEVFLERGYGRDGSGGLFPLKRPQKDQTQVEIWYQMHAYLNENYPD